MYLHTHGLILSRLAQRRRLCLCIYIVMHIHNLPESFLEHPELSSGICHLLGRVGTEKSAELKRKDFLFFEYFLLSEERELDKLGFLCPFPGPCFPIHLYESWMCSYLLRPTSLQSFTCISRKPYHCESCGSLVPSWASPVFIDFQLVELTLLFC